MADRALIDHLVASGIAADEAEWAVDRVFAAVHAVLLAGKTVGIPGVARIIAKPKPAYVPGMLNQQARMERKPRLMNVQDLEQGEPYDAGNRPLGNKSDFRRAIHQPEASS